MVTYLHSCTVTFGAVELVMDATMNRRRPNPPTHNQAETRIVWRDGSFRVECVGQGVGMRVLVYYGRFVLAEEAVESADICLLYTYPSPRDP
jgi:hypothetical protein